VPPIKSPACIGIFKGTLKGSVLRTFAHLTTPPGIVVPLIFNEKFVAVGDAAIEKSLITTFSGTLYDVGLVEAAAPVGLNVKIVAAASGAYPSIT